jgi:hypothetical protein
LCNVPENNLNLFDIKGYRPPTGDGSLQIRTDLARIPLNLPLFLKTSLVTSHVYSVARLFKRPYAVRDCPEKPPTTLPYKHPQPPVIYVKTRRKSLVSNKVYLQIGETGNITAEAQRSAEIRGEERQEPVIYKRKEKTAKRYLYKVAVPPQRKTKKEKTNLDMGKGKDGKKEFIYKVVVPPVRQHGILRKIGSECRE